MKQTNPAWIVIWLLTGAGAAAINFRVLPVMAASQANRDTLAPFVVPLFLIMLLGLAAAFSVLTGWLVWRLLGRRSMAASAMNMALWAGLLVFAQSEPGKALINARQPPVIQKLPPSLPACNESPPAGGQDLKTWEFQCAGRIGDVIQAPPEIHPGVSQKLAKSAVK